MLHAISGRLDTAMQYQLSTSPAENLPSRYLAVSGGQVEAPAGCTLSPFPWIPAHVAIQSMAICIGARQNLRRWPFMSSTPAFGADRAGFSPHEAAPKAGDLSSIPGGNHGDNLIGVQKRV